MTLLCGHSLALIVSFDLKGVDILFQTIHGFLSLLDRSRSARLVSPSLDSLVLLANATFLCVDFVAKATLLRVWVGVHDEFHAACFARTVFVGTMLAEVSPLVAVAGHSVLVIEAHIEVSGVLSFLLAGLRGTPTSKSIEARSYGSRGMFRNNLGSVLVRTLLLRMEKQCV